MFKWLIVFLCVFAITSTAYSQVIAPPAGTKPATVQVKQVPAAPGVKVYTPKAQRLGLFKRRKLGLTIKNITPIVKQLDADGQLTGEASVDAVTVAQKLIAENPQGFKDAAGNQPGDWQEFFDALIDFLEKLIPIIQMLISLFGGI